MEYGMLQATGYPAEIADFSLAFSAGYWGSFWLLRPRGLLWGEWAELKRMNIVKVVPRV